MRTATLDLTGIDLNDVDLVESTWNRWVAELFAEGFRPDEQPLPGPDPLRLTYRLTPLCGFNTFNRELLATA
jgi:hypothetical protein